MAWATPPTFVDGTVLSASQLNILVEDINHLAGIAEGVNIPFAALYCEDDTDFYVPIRHRHNNLHIEIECPNGADYLRIYYGATEVYADEDPGTGTYNHDISGDGLTVGAIYRVRVAVGLHSGDTMLIKLLCESESSFT